MYLALTTDQGFTIPWDRAELSFLRFVASFGIYGALGFFFVVLRRGETSLAGVAPGGVLSVVRRRVHANTAVIGLIGAGSLLLYCAGTALRSSYLKHVPLVDAAGQLGPQFLAQSAFAALLAVFFSCAIKQTRFAWYAAALVAVALALRRVTDGSLTAMVNPLHEVFASLWLGTLFVLVVAGLNVILRNPTMEVWRGAFVTEMVSRFSPLALLASGVVAVTGVITSWMKLGRLSALWSSPMGYVLMVKLTIVLVVVGLGAWNWLRVTPKLSTAEGPEALRRSCTIELWFALAILAVTAVLVVLPRPK